MNTIRQSFFRLFLVVLFLLPISACNFTPWAEFTAASGGQLYADQFDNPGSGWGVFSGEVGVAGY